LGHSEGADIACHIGDSVSPGSFTLDEGLFGQEEVMKRIITELVHEGRYAAKVEVELIEDESGWSPSYSLEDALKLQAAKKALRAGDLAMAAKYGHVFELTPVET
jgi:hypothetical protein